MRAPASVLGLERGGLGYFVAAVRECFEEAGVLLASAGDRPLSLGAPEVAARFEEHRRRLNGGTTSLAAICAAEGLTLELGRPSVLQPLDNAGGLGEAIRHAFLPGCGACGPASTPRRQRGRRLGLDRAGGGAPARRAGRDRPVAPDGEEPRGDRQLSNGRRPDGGSRRRHRPGDPPPDHGRRRSRSHRPARRRGLRGRDRAGGGGAVSRPLRGDEDADGPRPPRPRPTGRNPAGRGPGDGAEPVVDDRPGHEQLPRRAGAARGDRSGSRRRQPSGGAGGDQQRWSAPTRRHRRHPHPSRPRSRGGGTGGGDRGAGVGLRGEGRLPAGRRASRR